MRFDEAYGVNPLRPLDFLLEQANRWVVDNLSFVRYVKAPTLLISYERAMCHPRLFLKELAEFLGVSALEEAVQWINPAGGYPMPPWWKPPKEEAITSILVDRRAV
jgi:hypothetical protein